MMTKELEILKLQLELYAEKYDDKPDFWNSFDDQAMKALDEAINQIEIAQKLIVESIGFAPIWNEHMSSRLKQLTTKG